MKNILITGGAGFIGSHVVRRFVNKFTEYQIFNLDALTYAGNLENLQDIEAKEKDKQQSGYYMIKSLCHHFDPNQSLTSMTLIRDTFGEVD